MKMTSRAGGGALGQEGIHSDLLLQKISNGLCTLQKLQKKANSTLNFLRRNLRNFPQECRKTAYISLVRSILDYGSVVWDPYLKQDTEKLERVRRQAAYMWYLPDYPGASRKCSLTPSSETESPECENIKKKNILFFSVNNFPDHHFCAYVW